MAANNYFKVHVWPADTTATPMRQWVFPFGSHATEKRAYKAARQKFKEAASVYHERPVLSVFKPCHSRVTRLIGALELKESKDDESPSIS